MDTRACMSVSSRTGNTAYIADAAAEAAREGGWDIHMLAAGETPDSDVVLICFWCRKSSLDDASLEVLDRCEGKRILALGTFGGYPTSAYAKRVRDNVRARIEERNECLGVFLCQGKLPRERIEARRTLPPDRPHYLNDYDYERVLEGLNHPNATDRLHAKAFVRDFLPS